MKKNIALVFFFFDWKNIALVDKMINDNDNIFYNMIATVWSNCIYERLL